MQETCEPAAVLPAIVWTVHLDSSLHCNAQYKGMLTVLMGSRAQSYRSGFRHAPLPDEPFVVIAKTRFQIEGLNPLLCSKASLSSQWWCGCLQLSIKVIMHCLIDDAWWTQWTDKGRVNNNTVNLDLYPEQIAGFRVCT